MVEKNIDMTEELMDAVEMEEVDTTRNVSELLELNFSELTEQEKEYLISALKVKNNELDTLVKSTFKELDKMRAKAINQEEALRNTLSFIKTNVGNSYGAISLAIKHIEREVMNNGN